MTTAALPGEPVKNLICPSCRDRVQKATPFSGLVLGEPDPGYRHIYDKSAICWSNTGPGRAKPVTR